MKKRPKIKPAKATDNQKGNKGKENLIPWTKGQSGNPAGRPPKGKCIPDLLRKFGEWKCPESLCKKMQVLFPDAKDLTVQEAVYLRVYTEALQGESWAVQFVAERTEGKVVQPQEITLPSVFDLSKLSTAELLAFKALQNKIEIKETANE